MAKVTSSRLTKPVLGFLTAAGCFLIVILPRQSEPAIELASSNAAIPDVSSLVINMDGASESALAEEYKCYFDSDRFNKLVQSCCRTFYVPPNAQTLLPMNLTLGPPLHPATSGRPFGTRFRYLVGNGNDIVFNGATAESIDFINRYYGFSLTTSPVTSGFIRMQNSELLGDPDVANPNLLGLDHIIQVGMPASLGSEQIMAVDVSSLPSGSTLLYGNSETNPTATPSFIIKYCETTDPSGDLNQGLPMKVDPTTCSQLAGMSMQCTCGRIVILGWTMPMGGENHWTDSLIDLESVAKGACPSELAAEPPVDQPPVPADEPPLDPAQAAAAADPCSDQPDYDPVAQKWYYWTQEAGGGKRKMVRHWCASTFAPQEAWYKYQRYLPQSRNNFPVPPINDFDLLNSAARDYYVASRAERKRIAHEGRFDDWQLGNGAAADAYKQTQAGRARRAQEGLFDDAQLGNSAAAERNRQAQAGRPQQALEGRFDDAKLGNSFAQAKRR